MSNSSLLEAIAAAILDGATLTFSPAGLNGTLLPVGMVVEARLDRRGHVYRNSTQVGFEGLSLSNAADVLLAETLNDTMAPVIHAVLDGDDTGELLAVGPPPQAAPRPEASVGGHTRS
jgi:hypothetical protein